MPVALVVSDVSDATIIAGAVGANTEVLDDMLDSFGGFSGSPVYLPRKDKSLAMVGFVRAWSPLAGGMPND
jgi:hypothetical protein